MGVTAIAALTLEARDPSSLERFYREALGLELLSRDDDRVWPRPAVRLG